MRQKTKIVIAGVVEHGGMRAELQPAIDVANQLIWPMHTTPWPDVNLSFVDPEGKYIILRKHDARMHWGDCKLPTEFEYTLLQQFTEKKEDNEKPNVSSKPSIFKRDGKS